jgi:hypothetical protein
LPMSPSLLSGCCCFVPADSCSDGAPAAIDGTGLSAVVVADVVPAVLLPRATNWVGPPNDAERTEVFVGVAAA